MTFMQEEAMQLQRIRLCSLSFIDSFHALAEEFSSAGHSPLCVFPNHCQCDDRLARPAELSDWTQAERSSR